MSSSQVLHVEKIRLILYFLKKIPIENFTILTKYLPSLNNLSTRGVKSKFFALYEATQYSFCRTRSFLYKLIDKYYKIRFIIHNKLNLLYFISASAPTSQDGEVIYKDWVFINYTFKRFEGLTQRGAPNKK